LFAAPRQSGVHYDRREALRLGRNDTSTGAASSDGGFWPSA